MRGLLAVLGLTLLGCDTSVPDEPPTPAEDEGQLEPLRSRCVGDGDGVITPDEIPPVVLSEGLSMAVLVSPAGSQTTLPAGWMSGAGDALEADLSLERLQAGATDRQLFIGPSDPADSWYGARFPDAEWTSLLDADTGTWGLFDRSGDDVRLVGIASETEGETALTYDPPVPLFRLPMADGDTWEVAADAEGLADGVEYPSDQGANGVVTVVHRWSFSVDGTGTATLPAATLPFLRLRLALRTEAYNSIAGLFAADSSRATFLVSECAGTVARVRSLPDELDPDFAVATEVLRFGIVPELLP